MTDVLKTGSKAPAPSSPDDAGEIDLEGRVTVLEESIETTDDELYRLGHDFKFLHVEIGLVLDWIKEKFGVELINKESQIYKQIHHDHGTDEITAMKRSLAVPREVQAQMAVAKPEASLTKSQSRQTGHHRHEVEELPVDSEAEGADDREKDPDFDVRAAAVEGQSLVPVRIRSRVKRRRGSTSSGSSLESEQLQHHQRQAWRDRSRSRVKRVPPAQTPSVTPFVRKLWRMVDDPGTNQIIEWSPDGSGFLIHDQFILAQDLLPVNFKHNNIASFVRQLNWYGFRKYPGLDAECRFVHKYFKRGRPELLIKVRRRVSEPDGARSRARRTSRSRSRSRSPSPTPLTKNKNSHTQNRGQSESEQQVEEDPFELLDLEEMEEVTPYNPDPGPGDGADTNR